MYGRLFAVSDEYVAAPGRLGWIFGGKATVDGCDLPANAGWVWTPSDPIIERTFPSCLRRLHTYVATVAGLHLWNVSADGNT